MDRQPLTVEQRDAVFARRAEELASSASPESHSAEALEALVFALGAEQYALPANQVHELRPLSPLTLTKLPGTPAFFAGLINVRGRIVPVIDLRPLLGLPTDSPSTSVVLLTHPSGHIGLLVAGRPTVRPLPIKDLSEPPPGQLSGIDPICIRGITPGLVIVLDAERLLADPRLVVHHETLPKA
jgi:purine-binding chemotaxis protein CheW